MPMDEEQRRKSEESRQLMRVRSRELMEAAETEVPDFGAVKTRLKTLLTALFALRILDVLLSLFVREANWGSGAFFIVFAILANGFICAAIYSGAAPFAGLVLLGGLKSAYDMLVLLRNIYKSDAGAYAPGMFWYVMLGFEGFLILFQVGTALYVLLSPGVKRCVAARKEITEKLRQEFNHKKNPPA